MKSYMKKDNMPWLAIPFGNKNIKLLRNEFKVSGIPTLVIIDKNGKLISPNARWDVVMLGNNAYKAWASPKYKPLTYQDWQKKNGKGKKR